MEDKDFLGYFTQLGNKDVLKIKVAANNIVGTLLALDTKVGRKASMDSLALSEDAEKAKSKVESALRSKYQQGDLGEKMTADLNYTLKRLVRGLCSDNHAVKQGFFLASVLVLGRFKDQIDFQKYVEFVNVETKTTTTMKNPEIHAAVMGRMMCASAILESGWIAPSTTGPSDNLLTLLEVLYEIYKLHEFLREAIQVALEKILTRISATASSFDYILERFLLYQEAGSGKKESGDKKGKKTIDEKEVLSTALLESSSLSMFLMLRQVYARLGKSDGSQIHSKKYAELMQMDVLAVGNQKVQSGTELAQLIKQQTYLYPRLHSCVHLLIKDLFLGDDIKSIPKKYQSFSQVVLERTIFNEEALSQMKSVARLKLIHIGLRIVEQVFQELAKLEKNAKTAKIKLKMIEIVLKDSGNFRSILVKNVQMPKN